VQSDKRQSFRMNVELPFYIQPFNSSLMLSTGSTGKFLSNQQKKRFKQHDAELKELFLDETHLKNGAVDLFSDLNQRLDFLVWLLDLLMQGQNPRQQKTYYQRLDQDRLISLPVGNGQSSVFPLIHALYHQVDELISGLVETIENSVEGKVFLYTRASYDTFSGERYLHNLKVLAEKGNWLAKVLQNLIYKLNVYEQAYSNLKEHFQDLSYPERWSMTGVNLSSGGLGIETEHHYELDDQVCVLLQVGEQIMYAQAKVVAIQPVGSDDGRVPTPRHRVSFAFVSINPSSQALITQFVAAQELASAHPELK